jgi:hypothetical protein
MAKAVFPVHTMKAYEGMEVWLHWLSSAVYESEWSTSRPGRFTTRERALVADWIGGRTGPQSQCGHFGEEKKNSASTGNRTTIGRLSGLATIQIRNDLQPCVNSYCGWHSRSLEKQGGWRPDSPSLRKNADLCLYKVSRVLISFCNSV